MPDPVDAGPVSGIHQAPTLKTLYAAYLEHGFG